MKKSLLLSLSALSVSACGAIGPHSMPTGYTYHHDTYKSSTPPDSPRITTEQRHYMDATQAAQFRDGVYELVSRLTSRAGMPPKPVYVLSPDPMTTFYANIDNDLREAMRSLGYAISDMPQDAYVFVYDAALINQERSEISSGANNVELTLKVFNKIGRDARLLSTETGRYFIQGAELLHITPSSYDVMPSYYTIKKQAEGYDLMQDEPRTANAIDDELDMLEDLVLPKTTEPVFVPSSTMPMSNAVPKPMATQTRASIDTTNYNTGPSKAMTINSSKVSYADDSFASPTPAISATNRARVSRQMNY
jgi:hypothetical protein